MSGDTIFALSSGPPPAGVAVIRLTGPGADTALAALGGEPLPAPRHLVRRRLRGPANGEDARQVLDDGLVVRFPGPASFTGEDVVELHLHGGRAVVQAVVGALSALDGLRPAEPGEFTRRAFDNGKLDLAAVEGLADLVAAETEAQRRQAVRQLAGELGARCADWRERLTRARAHMEAAIDFSDEDLPDTLDDAARGMIAAVAAEIDAVLADAPRGERLRDGVRIAILGPPNAGKSSLLNALSRRDVAIVSEEAGTTRDVIEVHLDLGGYPVIVADTAGLRETATGIEQEGVRRARMTAEGADLRLVVFDGARWPEVDATAATYLGADAIGVVNKVDLEGVNGPFTLSDEALLGVSARTGAGLGDVLAAIATAVSDRWGGVEAPAITRARHRAALGACRDHLERAMEARGAELWAEDLRLALRELGRVVGAVGVEGVLDVIFRDFCIGK